MGSSAQHAGVSHLVTLHCVASVLKSQHAVLIISTQLVPFWTWRETTT